MILKHYFPIMCPSAYLSVFDSFLLEMFLQFFFSEILHNVSGTYKMQQNPSCEENSPWKSGSSIFLIIFAGRERIMTETSCFSEIRNSNLAKKQSLQLFLSMFCFSNFYHESRVHTFLYKYKLYKHTQAEKALKIKHMLSIIRA